MAGAKQAAKSAGMPNSPAADPRLSPPHRRRAGRSARRHGRLPAPIFPSTAKADNSPVSEADRRAEEAILARLSAAMPDVPVVAEEAVAGGSVPAIGRNFFLLVDPLDGTKEFISRNGEFTVNIGADRGRRAGDRRGARPGARPCLCRQPGGRLEGRDSTPTSARSSDWQAMRARPSGPHPVAVASRSHSNAATEDALAQADCGDRRSIGSSLKFCLVAAGGGGFLSAPRPDHGVGHGGGRRGAPRRGRRGGHARRRRRSATARPASPGCGISRTRIFWRPATRAAERLDLQPRSSAHERHERRAARPGDARAGRLCAARFRPRAQARAFRRADARPPGGAGDLDAAACRRRVGDAPTPSSPATWTRKAPGAGSAAHGIEESWVCRHGSNPLLRAASPPSAMSARSRSRRRTGRSCASG